MRTVGEKAWFWLLVIFIDTHTHTFSHSFTRTVSVRVACVYICCILFGEPSKWLSGKGKVSWQWWDETVIIPVIFRYTVLSRSLLKQNCNQDGDDTDDDCEVSLSFHKRKQKRRKRKSCFHLARDHLLAEPVSEFVWHCLILFWGKPVTEKKEEWKLRRRRAKRIWNG